MLNIDLKNNIDILKLEEASNILANGGIGIFPTETVYGIGTNSLNENSIKKLYEIKKRPLNKPITLLVSNLNMIDNIAETTNIEKALIKAFFPGPLTLVLKKKNIVSNLVTSGLDFVGVRMPANEITLKLIDLAGIPIATPSANISGEPSVSSFQDISKELLSKVDFAIDGGTTNIGTASTVLKIENGKPHILRQGSITEEQINEIINKV